MLLSSTTGIDPLDSLGASQQSLASSSAAAATVASSASTAQTSATSSTTVANPLAARLTTPTDGTTGVASTVQFQWAAISGAQSYTLRIGTTMGGSDVLASGSVTGTSYTASSLPTGPLYATLTTVVNGVKYDADPVVFTRDAALAPATMTSLTDGQTNVDASQPFTWAALPYAQSYELQIGTSAWAADAFDSGAIQVPRVFATNLPLNVPLYGTLSTEIFNVWKSVSFTFTVTTGGASVAAMINSALWATDFVRQMAHDANLPYIRTELRAQTDSNGTAYALCSDYAVVLQNVLGEMNVTLPVQALNIEFNSFDAHSLVQMLDTDTGTWMVLDPTFDLTVKRASDSQWASAADIQQAALNSAWNSLVYVPLGSQSFYYTSNYYLDYPLLYLNITPVTGSLNSAMSYLRPLSTGWLGGFRWLVITSSSSSVPLIVDGVRKVVQTSGPDSMCCVFGATSVVAASDSPAFELYEVKRYAFPSTSPASVVISATSFAESQAVGSTVASLATLNPGSDHPLTYSLVSGLNSWGNVLFTISGNTLQTVTVLSASVNPTVSIRVRASDGYGYSVETVLTLTVLPLAHLTPPAAGTTVTGPTATFQWNAVSGAQSYTLYVGTTLGASDVVNTGATTATSYKVSNLPYGQTLYARMWTTINGQSWYIDTTFASTPVIAILQNPAANATGVSTTTTFSWTAAANAQKYYLYVGTTQGAKDVVNSREISSTAFAAANLPAGQTLYVRLWTEINNHWWYADSTFTTKPVIAQLIAPANNQTGTCRTVTFSWNAATGVQYYYLYVGTTLGAKDVVDTGGILTTSYTAAILPGSTTFYVRLWTEISNQSWYVDTKFTTMPTVAQLSNLSDGATGVASTVKFQWAAVSGAQGYSLRIGTTMGGQDVLASGSITGTSYTASALPTGPLYATLSTVVKGQTYDADTIVFTRDAALAPAAMTSLTNGQTNVDASEAFTWTDLGYAQAYDLEIGTSAGAADAFDSGTIRVPSVFATSLPLNVSLYGTLKTEIFNVWKSVSFAFSAATGGVSVAAMIDGALWATNFVRQMASDANYSYVRTELRTRTDSRTTPYATCLDYATVLQTVLGEMKVSLPFKPLNVAFIANGSDSHAMVQLLDTDTGTWMVLDPTFAITLKRASDQQWASALDIQQDVLNSAWNQIVYVPLNSKSLTYLSSYYIDYPLLYLNILPVSGSVNSALPYLRPLTTGWLGGLRWLTISSTSASVPLMIDGVRTIVQTSGPDSLSAVFGATTITAASDSPAFELYEVKRYAFTSGSARVAISATSVVEGQAAGLTVASLATLNPGSDRPLTYSLVSGSSSWGNALFTISGTTLKTAAVLSASVNPTVSVRIRASDGHGYSVDTVLTLTVLPVAHLATAAAGTTVTGPTTVFQWNAVSGAQKYYLYVGTTVGANDVVNTCEITTTTYTGKNVPLGRTLYARMWTKINNQWWYVDSTFTATPVIALLQPTILKATGVSSGTTFTWSAVSNAQEYCLYVGTTLGAKDVLNSYEITSTTWSANLPPGQTLYVRLWTEISNHWWYVDSTITTLPVVAQLVAPADNATGVSTAPTFSWSAVTGAQNYYLYVGTTPGAMDVVNSGTATGTTYAAANLPTATKLYARMWTELNNQWWYVDSTFTTMPAISQLIAPANNVAGVSTTVTFSWTTISGAQKYYLYVGTTQGAMDVVNSCEITSTTYAAANLPGNTTLYARTWTEINNHWWYSDSTFTTMSAIARLSNLSDGATGAASTVQFQWAAVQGAQGYSLRIGTTMGGSDVLASGSVTGTSYTASSLPTGPLYATLTTVVNGVKYDADPVVFTRDAALAPATMTSLTDGQTNVDASQPFTWSALPYAQAYELQIGTSAWAADAFDSGAIQVPRVFATNLPLNVPLYGTLRTEIFNVWKSVSFTFTATTGGVSAAAMINSALWATDFVRQMANDANYAYVRTALRAQTDSRGNSQARCADYTLVLAAVLSEMKVSLATKAMNIAFDSTDTHSLVEILDTDTGTWMVLDPTFDLTVKRASDSQWASPTDIQQAVLNSAWNSLVYVSLGSKSVTYATSYYIDYPLLYLNITSGSGSVNSALPYLRPLPTGWLGGVRWLVVQSSSSSVPLIVDGVRKVVQCTGPDSLCVVFGATTVVAAADSPAFQLYEVKRYAFPKTTPARVVISAASVLAGQAAGLTVGSLATLNPGSDHPLTYSLVSGLNSWGNALFTIVGNTLQTAAVLSASVNPTLDVRVCASDGYGYSVQTVLTLTVT